MHSRRRFLSRVGFTPFLLQARGLLAQSGTDLTSLGISAASALMRNGELSPLELTEAYLQRIAQFEDSINAYIYVGQEAALEQARVLTEELARGQWRGPLHGIPLGLKDNIDTAGIPTTAANAMLEHRIPEVDAPVWTRLASSGAVLFRQAQYARIRVRRHLFNLACWSCSQSVEP